MAHILTILARQKNVILAVFVAILVIASTITLTMPKRYEAHMKVLVKHERADPVVSPDSSSALVPAEVSEADVNSEIELLTSTEVLREIVLRDHLAGNGSAAADNQADGQKVDLAVRELRNDLNVAAVRKASIIQIDYSSKDPVRAVTVLKTLADLYLETHLRVHSTAGAEEFFKTQASEYQQQLRVDQERLAELRRRDNVVLLPEEKELTVRRVMDTQSALDEARTSLSEAARHVATLRKQLEVLEPRIVTQSRVVPNQYLIERLNTMLAELQNRRTELLTKFRSDDRTVLNLDQQIKDTTAALGRAQAMTSVEQTTDVDPLRENLRVELSKAELELNGLEARHASLAANLQSWHTRLQQLDDATVEHDSLSREARLAEEKLVVYVKKQEEARIADALDREKIANVSLVEAPVRPYLPSQPNVPLNLVLGFLVACFASLGTGFTLEMNRTTFDSEDELESAVGLPVLASIPAEAG